MPEYDNRNSGLVFKQPRLTKKHPCLSGFMDVNGTEMDVSIWPLGHYENEDTPNEKFIPKLNSRGHPMYNIRLRDKEPSQPKQEWNDKPNSNEPVTSDDVDGSMPF